MIRKRVEWFVFVFIALAGIGISVQSVSVRALGSSSNTDSIGPFLGRWDLTIRTPKRELPSWIEVSEKDGQPAVLMVGVSDHATPLSKVEFKSGQFEFVSPKGEEGFSDDTTFTGHISGGRLVGTASSTAGKWTFVGVRAPSLKRSGTPRWGKSISLFNGRTFAGWRFSDPSRASVWKVTDGQLVKDGHGSEIISTSKFMDFKLHVEYNCGAMANSGVYLRGRYEVQIETDSASDPADQRMGAVYGFLTPQPALPRTPDVWQTYDITLLGRTITVVHDGQIVIDHQEIPGITGGALDSHEGLPGPIYLQGSEAGRVAFRKVVITPAL